MKVSISTGFHRPYHRPSNGGSSAPTTALPPPFQRGTPPPPYYPPAVEPRLRGAVLRLTDGWNRGRALRRAPLSRRSASHGDNP